jgi:uncharacterized membrane protein (DUF373 family)
MSHYLRRFEQGATIALIVLIGVVVTVSTVQLAWAVLSSLASPGVASFDTDRLLELFGAFLLVLIGVEMLETLNAYVHDHELRAELIILVAVIAIARKLITLDLSSQPSATLLGLAALITSLALAYVLIRRTRARPTDERPPPGPA